MRGSASEGPRAGGVEHDTYGADGGLLLGVAVVALDDDGGTRRVPGEADGVDAELVLDRRLERLRVGVVLGRGLGPLGTADVVEQVRDALGEDAHLQLLDRHRDQASATAGLEEEGAAPGRAHGAGDEALWRVEVTDRHAGRLTREAPRELEAVTAQQLVVGQQLAGRTVGRDDAVGEHDGTLAELEGEGQVVGDQ